MKIKRHSIIALSLMIIALTLASRLHADNGVCGGSSVQVPFMDVQNNPFFCEIAEAFYSGLTVGTTPTTYSPATPVPRQEMAAFVTRTLDQSLRRGSRRAALDQFWAATSPDGLGLTTLGAIPVSRFVRSDGADLWVANLNEDSVSRVRASDGKLLETWSGADNATGLVVARGFVFVTGQTSPGALYRIDPTQLPGVVTTLTSSLGNNPEGVTFDGARIWTANVGGSVSIVSLNPVSVTTVTTGFNQPFGILFDGSNIWVTDFADNKLKKLDANGNIIQSVTVGNGPDVPVFDGINIWVPNNTDNTVTVVRASTGVVLATLSGNGLSLPFAAAFDGERILVTNTLGNSVSLWKAADLTPLGNVSTGLGSQPVGACSDGLSFWVTLSSTGQLARF